MKNLFKKQILLTLSLNILTLLTPSIFAEQPEQYIPFSPKHQAMLDDIVQKFKLGNPGDYTGDYKGYVCLNATILAKSLPKEKKILINHYLLHALPKVIAQ